MVTTTADLYNYTSSPKTYTIYGGRSYGQLIDSGTGYIRRATAWLSQSGGALDATLQIADYDGATWTLVKESPAVSITSTSDSNVTFDLGCAIQMKPERAAQISVTGGSVGSNYVNLGYASSATSNTSAIFKEISGSVSTSSSTSIRMTFDTASTSETICGDTPSSSTVTIPPPVAMVRF